MKLIKDILFFETTTTGQDFEKDQILQLSAILLDKDNLLEKNFFTSYIRVSYLDNIINEHAKILGVEYEVLRKSPKIYDCIKNFKKHFTGNFILATHSSKNLIFLKNAFKKAIVVYDYDYHVLDLWTLGYVYTLNYGLKKIPSFNTFLEYFRLKQKNSADALEKVRLEAEIFRKIIKEV